LCFKYLCHCLLWEKHLKKRVASWHNDFRSVPV
jgi:hypothetical protein